MEETASNGLTGTIPELVVTPTITQIFSFSAVTWNRHKIHYNKDAALAEGHRDVVVQRALLGNYLALLLDQWLGQHGVVRKLSWKVLSSAVPGKPLRCQGKASIDGRTAHCELTIVDDLGNEIATGKAECMLNVSACR
jgi:hydroxyacyl-ACP dehydratase HTD2-like protein with hotdog domain